MVAVAVKPIDLGMAPNLNLLLFRYESLNRVPVKNLDATHEGA
jgi:hypothetical protein